MLVFENAQPPVKLEDINKFEEEVGYMIPVEYKEFLAKQNGGKPSPRRYVTKDGVTESSVMMFLPLADIDSSNLRRNFLIFNKANLIPCNLLPIAEAPRKHQICISLDGKDVGSVYHWFADDEEEEIIPSYDYMNLISSSFQEFINSLFDPQIGSVGGIK